MEELHKKLQNLKELFSKKAKKDEKLRALIQEIISNKFTLKEIVISEKNITLIAGNKTVAQELFFHKESIERKLKREVAIR